MLRRSCCYNPIPYVDDERLSRSSVLTRNTHHHQRLLWPVRLSLATIGMLGLTGLLGPANQPSVAMPISGTAASSATGGGGGPQRPGAVPATSGAVDGERLAEDGGPHRPTGGGGAVNAGGQTSHR